MSESFTPNPEDLRARVQAALGDQFIVVVPGYNPGQVLPVVAVPPAEGIFKVEVVNQPTASSGWTEWVPGTVDGNYRVIPIQPNGTIVQWVVISDVTSGESRFAVSVKNAGGQNRNLPIFPGASAGQLARVRLGTPFTWSVNGIQDSDQTIRVGVQGSIYGILWRVWRSPSS